MIDMGRTATARDPIARLGRHSLHHPIDQRPRSGLPIERPTPDPAVRVAMTRSDNP